MMKIEKAGDIREIAWGWAKENLLNRWYNTILSIVFIALIGVLAFYGLRFVFVTAQWNPVKENLTLFMIGLLPRAEQWRVLAQIALLASAIGLMWGVYANRPTAEQATTSQSAYKRYWAIGILIVFMLILTKTILPLVFVLLTFASLGGMYWLGRNLVPKNLRGFVMCLAVLKIIFAFQILSGTNGSAWIWTALTIIIALLATLRRGDVKWWVTLPAIVIAGAAIWLIYSFIDIGGVSWSKWSGFHLNLVVTIVALTLAFPLGILLALGRRSNLPAIKYISVGYIELIRGVPLIGLLFVGNIFLGFFLEDASSLSAITRAIVVMAIFTSAYLAEIFRGGFRAVPRGQTDAAKAVGLGPFQSFIWVTLPQTLRAIIPALVGQSISLFKDTSLLTIISITEILQVRNQVHGQTDFLTVGIAETLIFVSFAFWAISYTMSKESKRLETKLGVGAR